MSFYTYNQNNSQGVFDFDPEHGISHYVIVEANSARQADALFSAIRDTYNEGPYCSCCGERWPSMDVPWRDEEGDEVPSIYSEPAEKYNEFFDWRPGTGMYERPYFIHYLNGSIEG